MSEPVKVIATISKNVLEEVRIALDVFKGVDVVDVRIFLDVSCAGKRVATKKGISINVAKLPELIAGLVAAEVEARGRGLLPPETDERAPGAAVVADGPMEVHLAPAPAAGAKADDKSQYGHREQRRHKSQRNTTAATDKVENVAPQQNDLPLTGGGK